MRVTSLADSGPGTLRAALTASGPRIVIFEVGGTIHLKDKIEVFDPYLTIAGQTAPSPGITLAGDTLRFNTHDVLVRHLRIRPGTEVTPTNTDPQYRDGIGVRTNASGSSSTYNIYIDHCSVSWAVDENISFWYSNVYDVTLRNCIISEPARLDDQAIYSKGMVVGHGQRRISVLRNLFAHNGDRNPLFTADSTGMVVNNAIYNIGNAAMFMNGGGDGPIMLTVMGNVYVPGRDSRPQRRMVTLDNWHLDTRLFVDDNLGPFSSDDPWSVVDNRAGEYARAETPPVSVRPLTILSGARTLGHVLRSAGARPADRDAVDQRIVHEVRTGTGGLLRRPYDLRLPHGPATRRALSPPSDPTSDHDGDGYTDVEEWLHCMARRVQGVGVTLNDNCLGPREGIR